MTTEIRRASARSVLVSSLVLRRQAQARSTEASSKGFHIGATRPRPAGRQDGGHHGSQDGIITSAFRSRRPPLVRIACTSCPLSKWPLLAPFLLIFGKRTRASIYRDSHHSRKGSNPGQVELHTSSRTPLARLFFLCTVHHQPLRQSTTPQTRVGYYTTMVARTSINLVSLVL